MPRKETHKTRKEAFEACSTIKDRFENGVSSTAEWEQLTADILKLAAFSKRCCKMSSKLETLTDA